ncbi:SigE family RNA polymerase sigma factor [Ornithinicoccus halotolerans]|uniref:SigE family RNA polymerase sigma factor n=1 Tax=Ornithinicoccus halotolerans TaxID=1748220 RepID=UPI001E586D78|nr:SigE family RNA polymerase sigma factor [Ornithinicoccus halotolerans]
MGGESDEEFAGFVRDASPRLLAAAWLLTADRHSAEELVQDALERVYLRWPRLRSGQPLAYARKVMTNLHTDRWRRRRREVLVEAVPERPASERPSPPGGAGVDVVRALQQLPPRERQVVVWRYYLDQSEQRTAEELGVSPGTVKSSASRGLARMRELLSEGDESRAHSR